MYFIGILIAVTFAIALSAAYFSVYGLAYTFSGVFWSVVAMGASLEAGKLVATSYLYRYWTVTTFALRVYLMAGIGALMLLTSTGIFGYLSTGYQQDILPLKQKTEQITLLEEEKGRKLERKKQIDDLMANTTTVTNVHRGSSIDPNAARVLRETTKAREALVRQYKTEQVEVTKRISELDQQLLQLKQEIIKVEAHIGPITYIAKAFNLNSDDATKYLILIIIFSFDPMAVALTLAANIAIRTHSEKKKVSEEIPPSKESVPNSNTDLMPECADEIPSTENETVPEPDIIQEETPLIPIPIMDTSKTTSSWERLSDDKLAELERQYHLLKTKVANNVTLTADEQWELPALADILRKHKRPT